MLVIRDHLVRHPDRCTHQAICVPICPTSAWLSTPPYKFDPSRCLESCRLCLDACPSQAIYCCLQKGREAPGAAKEVAGVAADDRRAASVNTAIRSSRDWKKNRKKVLVGQAQVKSASPPLEEPEKKNS